MRRGLAVALCLLVLAPQAGTSGELSLADEHLLLSGDGIAVYRTAAPQAPRWTALAGTQTYRPVVTAGYVLVGTRRGLFAFNLADGKERWRLASHSAIYPPAVAGATAYAGTGDGRVISVDVATGAGRWQTRLPGWIYPPAVTAAGIAVGGSAARLWLLDTATGGVRWELALDQELVYRPVALDNRRIAVSTFAGTVLVADAAAREILWRVREPVPAFVTALPAGNVLSTRWDGLLVARDGAGGRELWRLPTMARPLAEPQVAGGVVLVLTEGGEALAVDATNGRLLRRQAKPPGEAAALFAGQPTNLRAEPMRDGPQLSDSQGPERPHTKE